MNITIIKRKFTPPSLPVIFLSRKRLLNLISKGNNKSLTLIQAGPGYGKSLLISDYIEKNSDKEHFWYSINIDDNDPIVFFYHIIIGLKQIYPDISNEILELLQSGSLLDKRFIHNIIGILSDNLDLNVNKPLILVIDNFHYVFNIEPINWSLEYLIEYLPENIQLILISRYLSSPIITRLQSQQKLLILKNDDLSFSNNEIKELSEKMNLILSDEDINLLKNSTEGWISGLILIFQKLKEQPPKKLIDWLNISQNRSIIFDYLMQEMLKEQSIGFKEFLLKSSMLPVVSNELIENILKIKDSHEYFQKLVIQYPFIYYFPEESSELMYHPIFQEYLQDQFIKEYSETELYNFYNKLGDYFSKTSYENSIDYYIKAKNYKKAIDIIFKYSEDLIKTNRINTLTHKIKSFPEDIISKSVRLQICLGEIYRYHGEFEKAKIHYNLAESLNKKEYNHYINMYRAAILCQQGDLDQSEILALNVLNLLEKDSTKELAFIYNIIGVCKLLKGKVNKAQYYFQKSYEQYLILEDIIMQAKILHNQGLVFTWFGQFKEAISCYKSSIKQFEKFGKVPYPMTHNNLAIIYYHLGNFEEAQKHIDLALVLAQSLQQKNEQVYIFVTLGRINTVIGKIPQASEYFKKALTLAEELKSPTLISITLSGMAELEYKVLNFNTAISLVEKALKLRKTTDDDPRICEHLIQLGEIYLSKKDYEKSFNLLIKGKQLLKNSNSCFHLTKVYIYLAFLNKFINKEDLYLKYINKAKDISNQYGYEYLLETYIKKLDSPLSTTITEDVKTSRKLKVFLLGKMKVFINDRLILNNEWKGKKTKLLFAYLLLEKEGLSREKLLDLIYPDQDTTRTAINVLITRIRKALEPNLSKSVSSYYIKFINGNYLFNFSSNYWVDVQDFLYFFQKSKDNNYKIEEQVEFLLKVVDIYKGDFLEEFSDDHIVQIEQENYRKIFQKSCDKLFDYFYKKKNYEKVIELADKNLKIDRCSDSAHIVKLKALFNLGEKRKIMQHYELMEKIYKKELDSPPPIKLEQLCKWK